MTTAMNDGRYAGTDRRRQRVANALTAAARNGSPITVSGIARQAGVDRTFLYRHRDLLALVHTAEREPATYAASGAAPVSRASLQADLANAQARNARLVTRVQQLEKRLSAAIGEQLWRESGLCAASDVEELQRTITRLEQQSVDLRASLDEGRTGGCTGCQPAADPIVERPRMTRPPSTCATTAAEAPWTGVRP
ncbi:DUF6262 family protein [Streptomyces sp. NPDC101152]|uniref:DUF6262 family protein n=1 Tax=Streptomyces sp. NPDC101152 TaxID=3366116 RepID=UPI00381EB66C